jgi:hypothetical protein
MLEKLAKIGLGIYALEYFAKMQNAKRKAWGKAVVAFIATFLITITVFSAATKNNYDGMSYAAASALAEGTQAMNATIGYTSLLIAIITAFVVYYYTLSEGMKK